MISWGRESEKFQSLNQDNWWKFIHEKLSEWMSWSRIEYIQTIIIVGLPITFAWEVLKGDKSQTCGKISVSCSQGRYALFMSWCNWISQTVETFPLQTN